MSNIIDKHWKFPYQPHHNQQIALEWLENQDAKYLILESPVGCHSPDTEVITSDGKFIEVRDVQIGDQLLGIDGSPRNVINLYSGSEEMFEVTTFSGRKYVVNKSHIMVICDGFIGSDATTHINMPLDMVMDYLYRNVNHFEDFVSGVTSNQIIGNGTSECSVRQIDFNQMLSMQGIDPSSDKFDIEFSTSEDMEHWFEVASLLGYYPYKLDQLEGKYLLGFPIGLDRSTPHSDPIISIDPLGVGEYCGFELDGDHLYLLRDGTITHNSGKSNIGVTYGSYLQMPSLILTPQRILQKQYEDSFIDNESVEMVSLYGKSNYECGTHGTNCEVGSALKPKCSNCVYRSTRDAALRADYQVLNYSIAFGMISHTQNYDPADEDPRLVVMDECHRLEQYLIDVDKLSISDRRCEKYNIRPFRPHDIAEAQTYIIEQYLPKIKSICDDLDEEVKLINRLQKKSNKLTDDEFANEPVEKISKNDQKKVNEAIRLGAHLREVSSIVDIPTDRLIEEFVLVPSPTGFDIKRLSAGRTFNKIIDPYGSKFLMMSSTILNHRGFCRDIGIDPDESAFLSLPSEFPTENRPVVYWPKMKMNYKWKSDEQANDRKIMTRALDEIIEQFPDENGIIHTGNFAIAEWLVEHLEDCKTHDIFHHNPGSGDDRNAVISAFMSHPKPSILISPSCTEGLDLKHDLGRFAIFMKIPYGNLGDAWIKKRADLSGEWYQRQAMIDIIQGAGRVVRGIDDHGTTFILDSSFAYLYNSTEKSIPEWWKDGLVS